MSNNILFKIGSTEEALNNTNINNNSLYIVQNVGTQDISELFWDLFNKREKIVNTNCLKKESNVKDPINIDLAPGYSYLGTMHLGVHLLGSTDSSE